MDKSKMVIKAEPIQQGCHGESSSAADAVITVAVDPDMLDCPICFHPLEPPVFQCAAGHVVCSACRDRLQDRNKCQVCAVATEYGRCYAVERILQSVRVLCPNAAHGCGVKMLHHEREAHGKECAHRHGAAQAGSATVLPRQQDALWLPANRLALILPEMSRALATFTISVGRKRSDKEQGAVVTLGPCGGSGGDARKMDMSGVNRVVGVVVRHGNAVDAMDILYERDGLEERTGLWGGLGGKRSEFRLQPDEYLTSVEGHYGPFKGNLVIKSLKFVSNTRTYGPYGREDGVPFALPAAGGGKILGFHARSRVLLNAIGTYVKMDDH